MPNTYTQIPIQFIFAVKKRNALILDTWRERFHQFVSGIVKKNRHRVLQINSMPDHVHLFVGLNPDQSCSELMKRVKGGSSLWINSSGFCAETFSWQSGFGAFSYSKSHVDNVVRYIQNQQAHHKKETFLAEYKKFLEAFEIDFDERYLFHEPI